MRELFGHYGRASHLDDEVVTALTAASAEAVEGYVIALLRGGHAASDAARRAHWAVDVLLHDVRGLDEAARRQLRDELWAAASNRAARHVLAQPRAALGGAAAVLKKGPSPPPAPLPPATLREWTERYTSRRGHRRPSLDEIISWS